MKCVLGELMFNSSRNSSHEKLITSGCLVTLNLQLVAEITEAFLLENAGHWHPTTRLRTNTKLNELHDMNVRQMRDDGTAWN